MTLYKVLDYDGKARMGRGTWPLPSVTAMLGGQVKYRPGEWMEVQGTLEPCLNGLHLANGEGQLVEWLGPRIFEAEYEGERVDSISKIVVRRARLLRETEWDDRVARLFACDCAERVLPLYEQQFPLDDRPRSCIETAREFANGNLGDQDLRKAQLSGWNAVDSVSGIWGFHRQAAKAVAMVTEAEAYEGALSASRYAANAAESARISNLGWREPSFERRWQAQRLREYLWPDYGTKIA